MTTKITYEAGSVQEMDALLHQHGYIRASEAAALVAASEEESDAPEAATKGRAGWPAGLSRAEFGAFKKAMEAIGYKASQVNAASYREWCATREPVIDHQPSQETLTLFGLAEAPATPAAPPAQQGPQPGVWILIDPNFSQLRFTKPSTSGATLIAHDQNSIGVAIPEGTQWRMASEAEVQAHLAARQKATASPAAPPAAPPSVFTSPAATAPIITIGDAVNVVWANGFSGDGKVVEVNRESGAYMVQLDDPQYGGTAYPVDTINPGTEQSGTIKKKA